MWTHIPTTLGISRLLLHKHIIFWFIWHAHHLILRWVCHTICNTKFLCHTHRNIRCLFHKHRNLMWCSCHTNRNIRFLCHINRKILGMCQPSLQRKTKKQLSRGAGGGAGGGTQTNQTKRKKITYKTVLKKIIITYI